MTTSASSGHRVKRMPAGHTIDLHPPGDDALVDGNEATPWRTRLLCGKRVSLDVSTLQSDGAIDAVAPHRRDAHLLAIDPWPLPARVVDYFVGESRQTTLFYWLGVALTVAGLFVTKLLPCVDYPQHLALSDVARRLAIPGAPERDGYQLNYLTYNGLFHVVVARLANWMPIEVAGRLVVALSIAGLGAAVMALVRVLRRPPAHALLFLPILFSFSLGWGFVNYVLGTAIAAWALVFVAHTAARPHWGPIVGVALTGLACAVAHVLAMLILCVAAAAVGLELAWRVTPSQRQWTARARGAVVRATVAVAPLLPACAYCIFVFQRQYIWDPGMYRDPTMEGSVPPLWEKFFFFSSFATDLYTDWTDQFVLWASIVVMGLAIVHRWRHPNERAAACRSADIPIVAPFLVLFAAYLATPIVMVGTHLVFPRLGQWAILGAVLAIPCWSGPSAPRARAWMLAIGLAAGVNTLAHCLLYAWETWDASAVIDDLPYGQAASAVIWEPGTLAFRNETLAHLAGYYAARKHGQWAFSFARYLSVPVRFKPGSQPAWPAHGWEFAPSNYDARCKYARAFPLVIVKAPAELSRDAEGETAVRMLVFQADWSSVRLMSHHGRYWAFDTRGLPEDGVL